MNIGRRTVGVVAVVSTTALIVLIFLAYRQPALLLDFLNVTYCG
jgi:hypothetical protein